MSDSPRAELDAELMRRVNAERSRNFRDDYWLRSRETVMALSELPAFQPTGTRISIIGSNGKGSTAFYLARLLGEFLGESLGATAPGPIGLYTSPHLLHVTERIRLDGVPTTAAEMLSELRQLAPVLGQVEAGLFDRLSYFEILTVLALFIFKRRGCPALVLEAGLGGRLDATRMARPEVVILTKIHLEHTEVLGDTAEAILAEKLGMITPETRLFIAMPQDIETISPELLEREVRSRSSSSNIRFLAYKPETGPGPSSYAEFNYDFARYCLGAIIDTFYPDAPNAPAARKTPEAPDAPPPLPGRLEKGRLSSRGVPTIFDVAHNEAGIARTLDDLIHRAEIDPAHTLLLIGMLPDRDLAACLRLAAERGIEHIIQIKADILHAPAPEYPAAAPRELAGAIRDRLSELGDAGRVVMLGSHRIYAYWRALLSRN